MLRGKVAIVTGGAGGIGKAICKRFAMEGAKVAVVDINDTDATAVVEELNLLHGPDTSLMVHCDVAAEVAVEDCVQRVVRQFGRLDILVNNAVKFVFGHLLPPGYGSGHGTDREVTTDMMHQVMSVNVGGYVNFMKYAAREMSRNDPSGPVYENQQKRGTSTIHATSRGSIVNICSVSSYIAQPEFAKIPIRVNAISPGSIETEGSHQHMDLVGLSLESGRKAFGESNLLKRQAAPEEIANGALFLASDESSFMTGSNMVMDGGGTI
jgi:NAD(P)-dependent dehydrogenase (short-subunit alcohol dehydrogenase family)